MRTGRALLGLAMLAGACAAPPPAPQAPRSEAPGAVPVTIEFEPALSAPARLQVVHESGASCEMLTQCTGVVVPLPPGPALLRLLWEGAWQDLPVQVGSGMPIVVWRRAW